jgi:hypothetical protein
MKITLNAHGEHCSDVELLNRGRELLALGQDIHISQINLLYALRVLLKRMSLEDRPEVILDLYGYETRLDDNCRLESCPYELREYEIVEDLLMELMG